MQNWPDTQTYLDLIQSWFINLQSRVIEPSFWLQTGVILGVFIIARWLLTPHLQSMIIRLSTISQKVPRLNKLLVAINELANTITWLLLQWIAIATFIYMKFDIDLLNIVASLLSAWLIIRLVTRLVSNKPTANAIKTLAWTVALLNIFGILKPTLDLLDSYALTLGSVRLSPLVVIKAGVALWLSLWLANVLSTFLDKRLETSNSVTPSMRVLSVKLLNIGLIIAAFLITFTAVGIDLTALAIFSGALGVGLGFGLQKIFSNLVSGVILLMDKSIKPGDVIAIGTTFGWINHLSARYVSVITRDGIEHLIPNEVLITERVENWSYSDNLVRLRLPIGISYKSDVRLAMQLCVDAAKSTPRILANPEPKCLLKGFGDSSVDLELRVWIDDPPNGRSNVLSEVLLGVWDRFHENNIEIPFPQRDLHLKSGLEALKPETGSEKTEGNEP